MVSLRGVLETLSSIGNPLSTGISSYGFVSLYETPGSVQVVAGSFEHALDTLPVMVENFTENLCLGRGM
jgi:hypothetical protein